MNSKRMFFVMIGLVVLLSVLAVVSVVGGNTFLQKQAAQLTDLKLQTRVLDEQQTSLIQANKDLQKYRDLQDIAKSVVPQDKNEAQAVREIVQIANASGIKIRSITFPSSNLGSSPTVSATTGSGSGSSSSSSTPTPKLNPLSQAQPVKGISGVYSLQMDIVPDTDDKHPIDYYKFLDFLSRLENNRRTAQVIRIKVDPVSTNKSSSYVSFTLSINIFVKP